MGEIGGETREEDELIENQDPELNRFSLSARGDVVSYTMQKVTSHYPRNKLFFEL